MLTGCNGLKTTSKNVQLKPMYLIMHCNLLSLRQGAPVCKDYSTTNLFCVALNDDLQKLLECSCMHCTRDNITRNKCKLLTHTTADAKKIIVHDLQSLLLLEER